LTAQPAKEAGFRSLLRKEMPGSFSSVFGEPEDFQPALKRDGVVGLLITGQGQFRAKLTQIVLHHLRLAAAEEELARIAFIAPPAGAVLVSLPNNKRPSPIWGGIEMPASEMITVGPGQRVHVRTDGPCRWAVIQMPNQDLVHYGRAWGGADFIVPPVARWRPRPAAILDLRQLYRTAIRMAEAQSAALADAEAAHGLEQQLIQALLECLSTGPAESETPAAKRHRDILARFEELLRAEPLPETTPISTVLGVSERTLRKCCKKHLGMAPSRYRHLRRMQQVHRILRSENRDMANVAEVARRFGFRDPGRFATRYRAIYGEPPSATLRRDTRGVTKLALGRPRLKFL
jgi:AraC-like DNA-binding protein